MDKPNGLNLRTFLIILGISVGILTTIFGVMGNNISDVESGVADVRVENKNQGERISTTEANIANINKSLERIEKKLDETLKYYNAQRN